MEIGAIILAAVGSAGLFNLIQFLITRKDKKKDALADIRSDIAELKVALRTIEKDLCRTQMLLLMADYPDQKSEMMELAQHYFVDLNGDFYMSSLFSKWLKANNMDVPIWFDMSIKKGEVK